MLASGSLATSPTLGPLPVLFMCLAKLLCPHNPPWWKCRYEGGRPGSAAKRQDEQRGPPRTGDARQREQPWRGRRPETARQQNDEEIPVVRPGQAASATFFSAERWADVGASEEVVAALAALGITRPSHIQVRRPCRHSRGSAGAQQALIPAAAARSRWPGMAVLQASISSCLTHTQFSG